MAQFKLFNGIFGLDNDKAYLPTPNTEPLDGDLENSNVVFWLDEIGDEIEVKAKKSDGNIITATIGAGGGGISWGDSISGTTDGGLSLNILGVATQATTNGSSLKLGTNFNTNSTFDWDHIFIDNEHNVGSRANTGIRILQKSNDFTQATTLGSGMGIIKTGNAPAICVYNDDGTSNTAGVISVFHDSANTNPMIGFRAQFTGTGLGHAAFYVAGFGNSPTASGYRTYWDGTCTANHAEFVNSNGTMFIVEDDGKTAINPRGATLQNNFGVFGISSTATMEITNFFNSSAGNTFRFRKSRSNTVNTWTATQDNDILGVLEFWGVNSSNSGIRAAEIIVRQDGAAGSRVPGEMDIHTMNPTTFDFNWGQVFLKPNGEVSMSGNLKLEAGVLTILETTTPTPEANYGKVYTKADNNLYFQDGGGTEHNLMASGASGTQKSFVTTRSFTGASETITIPHGLGIIPKYVQSTCSAQGTGNISCAGFSDGTNNNSSFAYSYDNSGSVVYDVGTDNTYSIYMRMGVSGAGDRTQFATITFDATNIYVNWTSSGSISLSFAITLYAFT